MEAPTAQFVEEAAPAQHEEPDVAASLLAAIAAGDNGNSLIDDEAAGDDEIGLEIDAATLVAETLPLEKAPLLTLEAASKRIGAEIFAALQKNFNGELSAVRYPDADDRIF